MTEMNVDEFVTHVFKDGPLPSFEPNGWYSEEGDSLEIFLSTRPYVAERVDGVFTLLVDQEDHERVVGIVIKQITKHFARQGINNVASAPHRARLEILILTAVNGGYVAVSPTQTKRPRVPRQIYKLLGEAGGVEIQLRNLEKALS